MCSLIKNKTTLKDYKTKSKSIDNPNSNYSVACVKYEIIEHVYC